MKLSELKTTFQHLYAAAGNNQEISLTANWKGTKVHLPQSGVGQAWKALHSLFPATLEQQHVKKALQFASTAFHKGHAKILQEATQYAQLLSSKCNKFPCNEAAWQRTRSRLIQWQDATRPFLKMLENPHHPLQEVFEKYANLEKAKKDLNLLAKTLAHTYKVCQAIIRFVIYIFTHLKLPPTWPRTLFQAKPSFCLPAFSMPHNKKLEAYMHFIRWERCSKIVTPYVELSLLCLDKTLTKEDEATLKKWIVKIEKMKGKDKAGLFHKALKAFLEHTGGSIFLGDLEYGLYERGCTLLCEDDSKFLAFRKQLKKGHMIDINGKSLVLGAQIGKKNFGQDRNIFFDVPAEPHKVLWIARNSSTIPIEMRKSELSGWGIRTAKITEIDSLGRWALVERLTNPLDKYKWTSSNGKLTPEDEIRAKPLANQLKWFVDHKLTPSNLSLRTLMFNHENILKSSQVLHPEELNLNKLEDVIKETNNSTVFGYLMLHSGLSELPNAKFYQKVVQEFLEGKEVDVKLKSYANEIDDPQVTQRAMILLYELGKLRLKAAQYICEHYRVKDQDALSKILAQRIHDFYKQLYAAGTLWPHISKELIQCVVTELKLKPQQLPTETKNSQFEDYF